MPASPPRGDPALLPIQPDTARLSSPTHFDESFILARGRRSHIHTLRTGPSQPPVLRCKTMPCFLDALIVMHLLEQGIGTLSDAVARLSFVLGSHLSHSLQ